MKSIAVVSGAFGERYVRMAEATYPTMKAYASRIGAEFIALKDRTFDGRASAHWEKLQLGGLLGTFERVLWLDADVAVRDDAPDILADIPEDVLGAWDEAPYGPWDYAGFIREWDRLAGGGATPYPGFHFNTGVMALGRAHRALFDAPPSFPGYELLWDQGWLNYRLARMKTRYVDIGHRLNHMFISPGNRIESFIIHYCGTVNGSGYAKEIPPGGDCADLIRSDLARWRARTR